MNARKLIYALLVGCVIGLMPTLFLQYPIDIESLFLRNVLSSLLLPGLIVSMVFSGWNGHTASLLIICLANFAFYTFLIYFILTGWAKFRAKSRGLPDGPAQGHSASPK
jgi:hypothetical protein